MACQFSDTIHASSVCLSSSNRYIAMLSGIKLVLRDSESLKTIAVYACIDKVDKFEFSPDSEYILCALYSRTCVQIFSVADPEWKCRINEGVAGLVNACWCPNTRSILAESDFGIQLTVWNLTDDSSFILLNPKQNIYRSGDKSTVGSPFCHQQLYSFSECGRFLAVIHRIDLHDQCAVYATDTWTEINRFQCRSSDVICVQWSPGGGNIVTTDSPLTYAINVYRPSGEHVAVYEAYEHALGVRQVIWTPNNAAASSGTAPLALVSVGSYDGRVRLLSSRTWQLAFVLPLIHPHNMDPSLTQQSALLQSHTAAQIELMTLGVLEDGEQKGRLGSGLVWVESIAGLEADDAALPNPPSSRFAGAAATVNKMGGSFSALAAHMERSSRTIIRPPSEFAPRNVKSLPRVAPDPRSAKAGQPAMGVHWQQFCPMSGRYLACREESQQRCLWIWSMVDVRLTAVLLMQDPILSSAWRPFPGDAAAIRTPTLAFCTGSPRIYFWTPNESNPLHWADVPLPAAVTQPGQLLPTPPSAILVSALQWSSDGNFLLLQSREVFLTCEVEWEQAQIKSISPTLPTEYVDERTAVAQA